MRELWPAEYTKITLVLELNSYRMLCNICDLLDKYSTTVLVLKPELEYATL